MPASRGVGDYKNLSRAPPNFRPLPSPVRPMKYRILAFALAGVLVACATSTTSTGRRQFVGAVSQAQLEQLGAQAFTEAKQKGPLGNDARQNAYVRCVVDAIVAQLPAQQRRIAWETAVFVQDEPNAYALPGGKVGVN